MERQVAKDLLHVHAWLVREDEIVDRGKDSYRADDLLQEAGDSLMMKLGEAANRLSRLDVLAPEGVDWALAVANRNFIIHRSSSQKPTESAGSHPDVVGAELFRAVETDVLRASMRMALHCSAAPNRSRGVTRAGGSRLPAR